MRSGFVESRHRGLVVVLDAAGTVAAAWGDVTRPVLPRSANKPLQAVGLLACGWDPADEPLALAVASHSGEPRHIAVVRAVLAAAGLDETALQCPPDYPLSEDATDDVVRLGGGRARVLMNCSGKHAGMLAACVRNGWDTAAYRDPSSPLQQAVQAALERLAGEAVTHVAVDGCGAAQHALTLPGLARAFLALVHAAPGSAERRVADAARRHPDLVGGTGRDVTTLMQRVPDLLAKDGAEGVFAAALPGVGAVAVKVEDGAARAAPVALAAALGRLGVRGLDDVAQPPVRGGGEVVGVLRPVL